MAHRRRQVKHPVRLRLVPVLLLDVAWVSEPVDSGPNRSFVASAPGTCKAGMELG